MNIKEFYGNIGENYNEVLGRLMKEERIVKYVVKFAADKSYDSLKKSISDGNYPEAFRAAHTLKGVAQNLGFEKLYLASSRLTEKLRNKEYGDKDAIDSMMGDVEDEYSVIVNAVKMVENR